MGAKRTCSVEGCERTHMGRGLCSMHYDRWRRLGDAGGAELRRKPAPAVCIIDGCDSLPHAHGLCSMHYQRTKPKTGYRPFDCAVCGVLVQRTTGNHRYCRECAAKKNRAAWERYDRENREKRKEARAAQRAADPEWDRIKGRRFYARHRKRIRAARRELYRTNPVVRDYYYLWGREHAQERRESVRRWRLKNPEWAIQAVARRRAKMYDNGVYRVTPKDWAGILRRYDHRCAYCGRHDVKLVRDHVIPITKGGQHSVGNLAPACVPCNNSKRERLVVEWRAIQRRRRGHAAPLAMALSLEPSELSN